MAVLFAFYACISVLPRAYSNFLPDLLFFVLDMLYQTNKEVLLENVIRNLQGDQIGMIKLYFSPVSSN